jgi:hypothetical protein
VVRNRPASSSANLSFEFTVPRFYTLLWCLGILDLRKIPPQLRVAATANLRKLLIRKSFEGRVVGAMLIYAMCPKRLTVRLWAVFQLAQHSPDSIALPFPARFDLLPKRWPILCKDGTAIDFVLTIFARFNLNLIVSHLIVCPALQRQRRGCDGDGYDAGVARKNA